MHACMIFGFPKQNNYNFQKFLIFLNFQKFENLGMLHTTTLKRNLVPRFEEARKNGFENFGFGQLSGLPPLKEIFIGSLECYSQTGCLVRNVPFTNSGSLNALSIRTWFTCPFSAGFGLATSSVFHSGQLLT